MKLIKNKLALLGDIRLLMEAKRKHGRIEGTTNT